MISTKAVKIDSLGEVIEGLKHQFQTIACKYESVDKIISNYVDKDFKIFKKDLSDLLVEKISLISSEMKKLLKNEDYLDSILKDGNLRANKMANENLTKLKNIIGLFKS